MFGVTATTTHNGGAGVFAGALGGGTGVDGRSLSGVGVLGVTQNGIGVIGQSNQTGIALIGESLGSGYAVLGRLRESSSSTVAIFGLNESVSGGGTGGAGGFGIYGLSMHGHGVVGTTTARGAAGILGATNGIAGTAAGAFFGDLYVRGALTGS